MLFSAISQMLAAALSSCALPSPPLHFGSQFRIPKNCDSVFTATSLYVFICFGRALGPLAVRFGHAGHEEYPALTWHIRSDDWDRLAARSGRGYYKKEGKRRDGGGEKGRGKERKREGTRVTIYGL